MTAAYHAALSQPTAHTWAVLVCKTATLVKLTKDLHPFLVLDSKERDALNFFDAIVRENADLLAGAEAVEPAMNAAPWSRVFA